MKQPLVSEEQLQEMLAALDTRRQAFSMIVQMYSQQIYWQLRRMVYSHEDANDLVQNTFFKAWEAIDGFRGDAKVSTWLYRIAHYEALNFLKKQNREGECFVDLSDEERARFLMARLQADPYFDGDEYEQAFQRALVSLPEKQQLVFRLRYYDEMPYEEIARITGTSQGALKASYHYASRKIAEMLSREDL